MHFVCFLRCAIRHRPRKALSLQRKQHLIQNAKAWAQ